MVLQSLQLRSHGIRQPQVLLHPNPRLLGDSRVIMELPALPHQRHNPQSTKPPALAQFLLSMEMAPLSLLNQHHSHRHTEPPLYLVVIPSSLQQLHYSLHLKPRLLVYSLNRRPDPLHLRRHPPLKLPHSQTYLPCATVPLLRLRVVIHRA